MNRHTELFPKRSVPSREVGARFKKWQNSVGVPTAPAIQEKPVKAIRLKSSDVTRLRTVHESDSPIAAVVKGRSRLGPDGVLSTVFSSVTSYEYTKLKSEYKRRLGRARTTAQKAEVETQWQQVVRAASTTLAAAGLGGISENDLDTMARELRRSRKNFNAVVEIANTGVTLSGSEQALSARSSFQGGWVPVVQKSPEALTTVITSIPSLCEHPFLQGSFTKHFSKSFSLKVRLKVWCPTWTNPLRTCMKTFTIAGVRLSLSIDVGYRVNCCGASAWGQASAEACGTIIGITVCASCSGKITGVAGISRSGSGSSCTYGLGINAELECKLAGITVFKASVPFGWTIKGPCPPISLCAESSRELALLTRR